MWSISSNTERIFGDVEGVQRLMSDGRSFCAVKLGYCIANPFSGSPSFIVTLQSSFLRMWCTYSPTGGSTTTKANSPLVSYT